MAEKKKYVGEKALSYFWLKIKGFLNNKVDKVEGKGLSTNDYTNAEKSKLANIADGAQANVIESIDINGTAQTITDKNVSIAIPTNNNQLTNGAGFINKEVNNLTNYYSKSDVYSKEEINELAGELVAVKDVLVDGESVVDENGIANIDKVSSNNKLYNSDDIDKDTYYSFTGIKTLDNIKIPISETETVGLIDAIYLLLDYDLDDLIDDYSSVQYAINTIIIPASDYISEKESKHLTIDLHNRGKIIAQLAPSDENYSFAKFTVLNYLKGWGVSFVKGNNKLDVLHRGDEIDPTVPEHVKKITQTNITNWNNKADKSQIPSKTSQLTNDSEFITSVANNLLNYYLKTESYSKEEINQIISNIQNVRIEIVNSLPTEGETNVIYFVKKIGTENDEYDEWIFVNGKKEHIGSTKVDLTGYATEQWVKNQDYMPIPDFHEFVNYMYYTKNETDAKLENYYDKEEVDSMSFVTMPDFREIMDTLYYDKEEVDNKLENLSTGGTELTGGDNTVIEDSKINVYTNTGYKVSDKDIQLQTIKDSGTTGTTKMVYIDSKEIIILYDGTNKIRRSENGIDFEIITLPCTCKHLVYNADAKRLYGTDCSKYFIYSNDYGLTWNTISQTRASGVTMMAIGYGQGFRSLHKSTKEIIGWVFNETAGALSQNTRITSAIIPEFTAMVNDTQFVWCNSAGTFKYGAGSNEGNFASLSGVTVNLLKRVNNITFLGLKSNNKFYVLEPATSITQYKWILHTLPDTCTLNDVIYNPYDKTYYLFTDNVTYYKTKDFTNFELVDKNNIRGIQGHFTLMGIQMTTSSHNNLLLAPTRTKLENKLQEHDRDLNKSLWVGKGLELTEEGKVNVKTNSDALGVSDYGIYVAQIDEYNLSEDIVEGVYVAKAMEKGLFDPYEVESWYYSEEAYPENNGYNAVKFIFTQDGSFYDQVTWETEFVVEKYEYGYLFYDANFSVFKYVKLGNLSWLLDSIIQ